MGPRDVAGSGNNRRRNCRESHDLGALSSNLDSGRSTSSGASQGYLHGVASRKVEKAHFAA